VAQTVEHLPRKHEALSLNLSNGQSKKKLVSYKISSTKLIYLRKKKKLLYIITNNTIDIQNNHSSIFLIFVQMLI
jgi:ABC-type uncharacterized transport system permease subunit